MVLGLQALALVEIAGHHLQMDKTMAVRMGFTSKSAFLLPGNEDKP
jgi:hypothetical protein